LSQQKQNTMTTLTLTDTIELYDVTEQDQAYVVEYALQDDEATANVTQRIAKKDLLQFLKDDGLDVCPVCYLEDNYRQVIKNYLENGFESAERRMK
jgi:hypothetical protein